MSKLAIILLDDYRPAELYSGFRAAFTELGLADAFKPGEKILIKPNLLAGVTPDKAVTPHPEVFRALIRNLLELQLTLNYGDSPAFDTTEKAARISGLAEVAESFGLPLADFNNVAEQRLPAGKALRQLPLAQGVADADGLVSLAKLKTHAMTSMTGVLKNQFGVIPGPRKASYHVNFPIPEDFSQMLVDINQYLKPRLYVMDAIVAMEGNGPRNGRPRQVGVILLSRDPVAVDAAGALLMGLDPAGIISTRIAAADGLGNPDLKTVEACLIHPAADTASLQTGTAASLLHKLQVRNFAGAELTKSALGNATTRFAPYIKQFVLRRPVIIADRCTRCGICIKACPAEPKVLDRPSLASVPGFDYSRCIRCFCCQEVCPAGAIVVKKTLIGRLLHI